MDHVAAGRPHEDPQRRQAGLDETGLPAPAKLRETDLVTAAGAIDRSMPRRIAAQRARRESAACVAAGAPRPWCELLGEEVRRAWSIARCCANAGKARCAFETIAGRAAHPPARTAIAQAAARARDPARREEGDDIAHCEALLARGARMNPRRCRKRQNRLKETGANHVPSPRSSHPNARDRERPINAPAREDKTSRRRRHRRRNRRADRDPRTATASTWRCRCARRGACERRLRRSRPRGDRPRPCRERLRALADRIERMRAARRK